MSEQQLRAMFKVASMHCEHMFTLAGQVLPLWHCVTAKGETLIVKPPSPDKDVAVAMMRALFEIRGVVRYLFLDEAWTLSLPMDSDELARIRREGVKDHPQRIEVVMFMGEDSECGTMTANRRIIRPAKRKPYLAPLKWTMEPGSGVRQSEGRMVGLLPVPGRRQ